LLIIENRRCLNQQSTIQSDNDMREKQRENNIQYSQNIWILHKWKKLILVFLLILSKNIGIKIIILWNNSIGV